LIKHIRPEAIHRLRRKSDHFAPADKRSRFFRRGGEEGLGHAGWLQAMVDLKIRCPDEGEKGGAWERENWDEESAIGCSPYHRWRAAHSTRRFGFFDLSGQVSRRALLLRLHTRLQRAATSATFG